MKALNSLSLSSVLVPPKTLDKPNDNLRVTKVAGAWDLNKTKQITPTVLVPASNMATFFAIVDAGITISNVTIEGKPWLQAVYNNVGGFKQIGRNLTTQNYSGNLVFGFKMKGSGSGGRLRFELRTTQDASSMYYYRVTDNFTDTREFIIPINAMATAGTPNLNNINGFGIVTDPASGETITGTILFTDFYLDVGVGVTDYSGNGYDAALYNGASSITATFGNGILFDGVDDYGIFPLTVGIQNKDFTFHTLVNIYNPKPNSAYSKCMIIGATEESPKQVMMLGTNNGTNLVLLFILTYYKKADGSQGAVDFYLDPSAMTNKFVDLKIRWNSSTRNLSAWVNGVPLPCSKNSVNQGTSCTFDANEETLFDIDPTPSPSRKQIVLGGNNYGRENMKIAHNYFIVYFAALSDDQMKNLNYIDPTLEAGKAFFRGKYTGSNLNKRIDHLRGD